VIFKTQGLAAFGVPPTNGPTYLIDLDANRIVAEGPDRLVRARVLSWNDVSPGRYQAATADNIAPEVLVDWRRYKEMEAYWVIADGE